jgi:hypothetical protein
MKYAIRLCLGELDHRVRSNYKGLVELLEDSDIYVNVDGWQHKISSEDTLVDFIVEYL